MTVVVVPFHQDVRLADDLIPLPPGGDRVVLDPELPEGDIWHRLTALYETAATQIAAARPRITVISGDCLVALATLAVAALLAGFARSAVVRGRCPRFGSASAKQGLHPAEQAGLGCRGEGARHRSGIANRRH